LSGKDSQRKRGAEKIPGGIRMTHYGLYLRIDKADICWDTLMQLFSYDKVWDNPLARVNDTIIEMGEDACLHTLEFIMSDAHERWHMDEAYEAMSWLRRGCPE